MDCGVQNAMLSIAPGNDAAAQQALSTASLFPPNDSDQAQFEADKRSVYKHPLFPLLALLFERCELATQSSDPQSSNAFSMDIQAFVQHQERDRKPFLVNEPEIDGLMVKAIQVLRIHLLELEKVQELCKDFCNRYITCLKGKMQSENLLRSDYPQGPTVMNNNLESSNNNSLLSHANSESGSESNSPVQYTISPNHQVISTSGNTLERQLERNGYGIPSYNVPTPNIPQIPASCDNIIHGSTPLSQIGITVCPPPPSDSSGQLSPAPTTPGGSEECDSDFNSRGRKQKRGVLPKHATSVMRSWLFQHLVHPYPTEDEKRHIAAQTNLTLLQVNNWFINARRRILQPMLDASGPNDNSATSSPAHKKKKVQNNNRRFWPQDFGNMQPQLDSGMLSSSDDEGDSYSSDGDEGSLVIDSTPQANEVNQNGHTADPLVFVSPKLERPYLLEMKKSSTLVLLFGVTALINGIPLDKEYNIRLLLQALRKPIPQRPLIKCTPLFDENCIVNPGDGHDEEWMKDPIQTPGKRRAHGHHLQTRCANLFDESCIVNPGDGDDEEWMKDPIQTPGKRRAHGQHLQTRCANLFDESCIVNPGDGDDEEWMKDPIQTPGKRRIYGGRRRNRCANLFDESCIINPGDGQDEEWINNPGATPGKRNF